MKTLEEIAAKVLAGTCHGRLANEVDHEDGTDMALDYVSNDECGGQLGYLCTNCSTALDAEIWDSKTDEEQLASQKPWRPRGQRAPRPHVGRSGGSR